MLERNEGYVLLSDAEVPASELKRDHWIPSMPQDTKDGSSWIAGWYWCGDLDTEYPWREANAMERYTAATWHTTMQPLKKLYSASYFACGTTEPNTSCMCCLKDCICCSSLCLLRIPYMFVAGSLAACGGGVGIAKGLANRCMPLSPQQQSMDFPNVSAAKNHLHESKDLRQFLDIFNSSKAVRDELIALYSYPLCELIYQYNFPDVSFREKQQALLHIAERGYSILGDRLLEEVQKANFVCQILKSPHSAAMLDFVLTTGRARKLLKKAAWDDIGNTLETFLKDSTITLADARKKATVLAQHGLETPCHVNALKEAKRDLILRNTLRFFIDPDTEGLVRQYAREESILEFKK